MRSETPQERAQRVRLLILDVDGVLTDGGIYVGPEGELFKPFNVRDGLGLTLWHRAGGRSAIITGRASRQVELRAHTLHITEVFQGKPDKRTAYGELKAKLGVSDAEVAYVGDDLIDLAIMLQAGFPAAPADAAAEAKGAACYVARSAGGHGAVRDVIEYLLKAQGKWDALVAPYYDISGENASLREGVQ